MTDLQPSTTGDGAAGPAPAEPADARNSRRSFLKFIGGGGAAALVLAGCDTAGVTGTDDTLTATGTGVHENADVVLDFSTDIGVLNYAYALEQLEAAFYIAACDDFYGGPDVEEYYLKALRSHENAHADFYQAAIPAEQRIGLLEVDFSSIDFGDRTAVLSIAQALEDTGVSAYNGAGRYLTNDVFLTLAGKIVSVEARHAAAIRSIFSDNPEAFADLQDLADLGFGAVPEFGFDAALPPDVVLQRVAATGLVTTTIAAINL